MVKDTTNNVVEMGKVLSYWTNKLCHGLTITEKALKCSHFNAFDASLEKPKEFNNSKNSLSISKTTLCSLLLESNIENSHEMIDFFDKVPFVNSEPKKSWSPQPEDEFNQTIHFKIINQQIEVTIQNTKPSNNLLKAVTEALDTQNPFNELEIIFNKYGHILCQKVVLGGKLSRTYHLSLKGPIGN